jgi:hypothetical protein
MTYWLRWWNKLLSRVLGRKGRREEGRGEERRGIHR